MTQEIPPPLYPPGLPQTGWTTESPWCAALQIEKEEFLSLLERFGVPHIPFGRSVLIDVSKFYQHMSALIEEPTVNLAKRTVHRGSHNPAYSEASPPVPSGFAVLTKKQVAELLQCSSRQVELLVKKGRLPGPVYMGDSSPRWKRSEIEAIFDEHARLTDPRGD